MAELLSIKLPEGWTAIDGGPKFNNVRIGRAGAWQIVQNDDYAVWQFAVSYVRSRFETAEDLTFDDIYSFFLTIGSSYAFLVDDILDNTHNANNGAGTVASVGGVFRTMKRYTFGAHSYLHPITRLVAPVELGGAAAGGTLDLDTGIITGVSNPSGGSWAGNFLRPMIFLEDQLTYRIGPDGIVESFGIVLQEQLEI